jgi:hypothetical protein
MGRIRLAWRLARESWAVLTRDRSLVSFPVLGFAVAILAVVVIMAPGVALAAATGTEWLLAPFALVAAYAATFAAIFYGVALAAAASRSLDGEDTTLADGLAVARRRRSIVAQWAGVQLFVGLLISAIEAALSDSPVGRIAGSIIGGLANVAWAVATFFVVPLVALEGLGPKAALKRSGTIIRERWGEGIAGSASIGLVIGLAAAVPIAVLVLLAIVAFGASPVLGGVVVALAVLVALAAAAIGSALNTIFRVALLRYATTGEHAGSFAAADLQNAFAPRGGPRARFA